MIRNLEDAGSAPATNGTGAHITVQQSLTSTVDRLRGRPGGAEGRRRRCSDHFHPTDAPVQGKVREHALLSAGGIEASEVGAASARQAASPRTAGPSALPGNGQ